MTVFKASQPVQLTPATLAGLFNFLRHNPHIEGLPTSTEFKAETQDHSIEVDFRGHGFTYNQHGPTGGTITSLQINEPAGTIAYKFTAMAISIPTLVSDVNSGHFAAALSLLLPGHDVINGSSGPDLLNDYGGHDRITGGAGNDTMNGAHGYDQFIFRTGFGHDKITHFVTGTGANHDTIVLHSDTGLLTMQQVKLAESYDSSHNVVLTDSLGDTITFAGIHNKAALNADFHLVA
jgi:Ca2+-binding RTX toxin-like protein